MVNRTNLPSLPLGPLQHGQGEKCPVIAALECLQPQPGAAAQRLQLQPEDFPIAAGEPTQTFPHQHGGTAEVAPLQVELGDRDLENALQHRPHRPLGLVPQLLESIVAAVPVPFVEAGNGQGQTGIGEKA